MAQAALVPSFVIPGQGSATLTPQGCGQDPAHTRFFLILHVQYKFLSRTEPSERIAVYVHELLNVSFLKSYQKHS